MPVLVAILALLQPQGDTTFRDPHSGEVTLAGNLSELIEHSRDSTWLVGDLAVWNGRLFSTGVREYLPTTDAWRDVFPGATMFMLRALGKGLATPHWSGGAVRFWDGAKSHEWVLPGGHLHTMDVAEMDGTLYVSTGSLACGRVFSSTDNGATWKEIRRTRKDGRVLDMAVFKGRLFANERGEQLIAWDGKKWEEIRVQLPVKEKIDAKLGNAHLFVFKDKLLAVNIGMYYVYDGKSWTSKSKALCDLWVEGPEVYALTEDGHVERSRDGLNWTRVTRVGVPPGQIAGAGSEPGAGTMRPLQIGAIAMHRRRLFVGTSVKGLIYASPYVASGMHTSEPQRMDVTGPGKVAIEAVVPEGTRLSISIRTAPARNGFNESDWKEAEDGAAIEIPAGHQWLQWRARLESEGRRTPVVRSVGIRAPDPQDGPSAR